MQTVLTNLLDHKTLMLFGFVFVSVGLFVVVIGTLTVNWLEIRRRTATGGDAGSSARQEPQPDLLLYQQRSSALANALLPQSEVEKSELRRFLNLAGFHGRSAPVIYQLVRYVLAIVLGIFTAFAASHLFPFMPFYLIISISLLTTLLGFFLPKTIVSLRRDSVCDEHRRGFPDFLDLLTICVEAGIGIDSAIERVGQDLGRSYPSLARNLGFMTMEMRAGRSTRDALDALGQRLGIDEARSFATLIRQSEELGTSLSQSLRVYSNEMRSKRIMRAEEKAYALPAKLVIPLGLFIFPIILGVTLLPVAFKISKLLAM